jgi:hypothetical protein
MANPYRFKIGETVTVALEAVGAADADLAGIAITAVLKLSANGAVPPLIAPIVATFTCVFRPADDGVDEPSEPSGIPYAAPLTTTPVGPGWNLSLTAAQTLGLVAGSYVTNAVLTFPDGTVQKTDPLFLQIEQATQ